MADIINLPVPIKAINDKLPAALKVLFYGGVEITDQAEQINTLRAFVRASILKMFGVTSVQHQAVSVKMISFNQNEIGTKLKLPKVTLNVQGHYAESLEAYYKRVLPSINTWLQNALHNSVITPEDILKMD